VGAAEGNPFYIEELIKMLIDDGAIVKEESAWLVTTERLAELKVPATLTAVLQARLDALPPEEREMLHPAAVIGPRFWDAAVATLLETDEATVSAALEALHRRELIFPGGTAGFSGASEYAFKHKLLHDVTYESVLLRLRTVWHQRAAQWLIDHAGHRADVWAPLIAEHWERGGEPERAGEWYVWAGQRAQSTFALEEAEAHYRKALDRLPEAAALRVEALGGLGELLMWQARSVEAAGVWETVRTIATLAGDEAAQSRACVGSARVMQDMGRYEDALVHAERGVSLAQAAGSALELMRALFHKGWCLYKLDDLDAAQIQALQGSALASRLAAQTQHNDVAVAARREEAENLRLLGAIYDRQGRYREAADCNQRALREFRHLGDVARTATTLNLLGEGARLRGEYREAAGLYRETVAEFRRIGHRRRELLGLSNLGGACVGLGEHEEAERLLRQVIAMAPPEWQFLPETHRFLAEALLGRVELDRALEAARKALKGGQESGAAEFVGPSWRILAEVIACTGATVEVDGTGRDAPSCFEESLRSLTKAGIEPERARTLRAWARYELTKGDRSRGGKLWRQAKELFSSLGMDRELSRMQDPPTRRV